MTVDRRRGRLRDRLPVIVLGRERRARPLPTLGPRVEPKTVRVLYAGDPGAGGSRGADDR